MEEQNLEFGEIKRKFLSKFRRINKYSGFTPFTDSSIGFSVTRKSNKNSPNLSLIKVALREGEKNKKQIYMRASFGVLKDGVLENVENRTGRDPIDIESADEYFYDVSSGSIYSSDKKITAQKMMDKFYDEHVKSTYLIKGLGLRIRVILQIKLQKIFFDVLEKLFQVILKLISGTSFSYSPILQTERINTTQEARVQNLKLNEGDSNTIRIFNYEASKWSVLFFIVVNLLIYIMLMITNFEPRIIKNLIENNFLVLLYAILTLWLIDSGLPHMLKKGIKYASNKSFETLFKKIRI